MLKYTNTQANLAKRADYLQRQLMLVQTAQASLRPGAILEYQVHIQTNAPGILPIVAQNHILEDALQEATELYRERNHRNPTSFEVFACIGRFRVAIDPKDLPPGFTLDSRITDNLAQMVFAPEDKLPSAHYAENRILVPA